MSLEVECHLDHSTPRIRNVPQPRDIGPITTRVMHKSRLHRILEVEKRSYMPAVVCQGSRLDSDTESA